jgi:hypothetical protein
MWNWGRERFGYKDGDSLFTYLGPEVGRFDGDEIYGVMAGISVNDERKSVDNQQIEKEQIEKELGTEKLFPTVGRVLCPVCKLCGLRDVRRL